MNIYQPITKHCHKCNTHKPTTEFYKNNNKKDGYKVHCKQCNDVYQKEYYRKQAEKKLAKPYKLCKVCKIGKSFIEFNTSTKNKDGYKTTCIECNNAAISKRKQKRREQTIANIPHQKEKRNQINRERLVNEPLFKLTQNIRSRITNAIRGNGYDKRSKTTEILGCSFEEFYTYIENQFADTMSWNNRSLWHIDHIVPVSFCTTEEEIHMINHYTNLRPLWAKDNMVKGDKLTEDVIHHPIYKSILELRSAKIF